MALSEQEQKAFREFEEAGWGKAATPYHRHWGGLTSQSSQPMLDAAGVASGSKVLDIATGPGYVASAAQQRGAEVIGIDFSEAQIELARSVNSGIEFKRANAEDLPFADNSFDAVVVGFGINHLPDPDAVFAEAHRVLNPGGRMAFTVWAPPREGQAFGIVMNALEKFGDPSVKLPAAPPYFLFADAEDVAKVFNRAGFTEPKTEIVAQCWRHSSPDMVFDAFNEGAVRVTALLQAQPDSVRQKIRSAVQTEVLELMQDGQYVIPVPAALSSARKS